MMTGESRVIGSKALVEGEAGAESDPHSRREARQTLRLDASLAYKESESPITTLERRVTPPEP